MNGNPHQTVGIFFITTVSLATVITGNAYVMINSDQGLQPKPQ